MLSGPQLQDLAESFAQIGQGCLRIRNVLQNLQTASTPAPDDGNSILQEDFQKTIQPLGRLITTQLGAWNEISPLLFFKYLVRNRIRCNRSRMFWFHLGGTLENKHNWRKVSKQKVEEVFMKIREAWDDITDHIRALESPPEGVTEGRWNRREKLLDAKIPLSLMDFKSEYREVLQQNHEDLPKLR